MGTYKSIFKNFELIEEGDFFAKYLVKNVNYIVYMDSEEKKNSCIESCNFSFVSKEKLKFLLNIQCDVDENDEFIFQQSLNKEQILSYLFDVSLLNENGEYNRYVGKGRGYTLKSISGKLINLFEIVDDKYYLRFSNKICLNGNEKERNKLLLSFNPIAYEKLMSDGIIENDYSVFLLAADNIILFEHIHTYNKEISIYVDNNYIEALHFLIFYANKTNKLFNLYKSQEEIVLTFEENIDLVDPDSIMNFISNADNILGSKWKESSPYKMDSNNGVFFIVFENCDFFIHAILKSFREQFCNSINLIYNYSHES